METVEGITVNIYTTKRTVTILGRGTEIAKALAMTIDEVNNVDKRNEINGVNEHMCPRDVPES